MFFAGHFSDREAFTLRFLREKLLVNQLTYKKDGNGNAYYDENFLH